MGQPGSYERLHRGSGIVRSVVRALVTIGAVAAVVPATAAAAISAGSAAGAMRPDRVLSNETTRTTWTIADVAVEIRTQPAPHATAITKLFFQSPDGFLQSYVLLRERFTKAGTWVELRIPGRPNGRIGWVPRSALDQFEQVHTEIVVNREKDTLTLYRGGKDVFSAPVGVGKPGTPTPAGHFWVTESFVSHDPFYGPWLMGTSDYSTLSEWPGGGIVGIHGTNEPQLVPGDPSHGCIRMHNSDISRLYPMVPIGTPLLVE